MLIIIIILNKSIHFCFVFCLLNFKNVPTAHIKGFIVAFIFSVGEEAKRGEKRWEVGAVKRLLYNTDPFYSPSYINLL